MTVEEVKARLQRYNNLRRECRKLQKNIRARRVNMTAPRAIKTDALPGGRGNSLEAAIERIDELERELHRLEHEADIARADAETLIGLAGSGDGREILRLRYLDGVRFEEIPDRLPVSYRTMYRRYKEAIHEIAEKLAVTWQ